MSSITVFINVDFFTCIHCYVHECATQIRYASTRSRFQWLLISPARMPQRRQLNTDQTPPLSLQINYTYYSLRANERIASSFYVFCAPVFAALHGMQTRSSDENYVCPSVCPSVKRVIPDKIEGRSVQNFIS